MATQNNRNIFLWISVAFLLLISVFVFTTFQTVKQFADFAGDETKYFSGSGSIAVMKINGAIMNSDEELAKLRELGEKKKIKAVVLRISSPGGAVGPSQEIYDAVLRLKRKKPVICSLGDLAASGGYYIASACESIFANPGTLTGSIGVIMHFMNLKDLYSWAKVQPNIIKSGKFKDIGSETRNMTDEERKLLQDMILEVHQQFKDAIMIGRNKDSPTKRLTQETLNEFADGRIFSGRFAREKGFVDELGGEYEALQEAKRLANVTDDDVVREVRERSSFRDIFSSETTLPAWLKNLAKEVSPTGGLNLTPGVPYLLPSHMFQNYETQISSGARAR